MEHSIIDTLEGMAADAEEDFPELQRLLNQHIETTKAQAERVKGEIERLGGTVSGTKKVMADIMGSIQGLLPDLAKDKVIKNLLAGFATENMEIASYKAIAAAAEEVGETQTVQMARDILNEERGMAKIIDAQLEPTVVEFLRRHINE